MLIARSFYYYFQPSPPRHPPHAPSLPTWKRRSSPAHVHTATYAAAHPPRMGAESSPPATARLSGRPWQLGAMAVAAVLTLILPHARCQSLGDYDYIAAGAFKPVPGVSSPPLGKTRLPCLALRCAALLEPPPPPPPLPFSRCPLLCFQRSPAPPCPAHAPSPRLPVSPSPRLPVSLRALVLVHQMWLTSLSPSPPPHPPLSPDPARCPQPRPDRQPR